VCHIIPIFFWECGVFAWEASVPPLDYARFCECKPLDSALIRGVTPLYLNNSQHIPLGVQGGMRSVLALSDV
jgi:hypothetical protein